MSQDLPSNKNSNEEVDLIVFFNLIGNAFNKLFSFVYSILKRILSFGIFILRAFINNWKIILGIMVISACIGYGLERTKKPVYKSSMLVKPYFDSKYQLVTNINYFNALIGNKDYSTLKSIFNIEEESLKHIKGFTILPGPETENDKILQYNDFLSNLYSKKGTAEEEENKVKGSEISFDDYIENRSVYTGNLYTISAESYQKDVFKSLEDGLFKSFSNDYSAKKMLKRDSVNSIKRENILANLKEVDSLKRFYMNVLKDESQKESKQIKLGDISLSSQEKKTSTREFELLKQEITLRDQLRDLDQQNVEEDEVFDIISSFQPVGSRVSKLSERYSIIFPVLAFALLCLLFVVRRVVLFTEDYE